MKYGFKTFIMRKEMPYLFGIVITDKCNLNCFYCESKNSGLFHLDCRQAEQMIADAYARGHRSLYFTGGEPMVWEDSGYNMEDLVVFARKLGFDDVFIFTNGTIPLSIKDCNYIVTIDGPRDIHNNVRGGSYDLVMQNAEQAVTDAVFASITFCRANAGYLEQYVREISDLRIFKGISFNFLTHWPEIVATHGINGTEKNNLLDAIWKLKKQGYPLIISRAAYHALKNNDWKRPISQIELGTKDRLFTCCRDVDNPEICANCGYVNCVEVAQILALKPSAMWQVFRITG